MLQNSKIKYTATSFPLLENVLAEELRALDADDINILKRAVSFIGDKELLYKSNLWLRSALRVLVPIHDFIATDENKLYKGVRDVDWSKYLDVKGTLAVESAVHSRYFNHSKYVALKTKDAIVDQFRDKTGARPSVDTANPDLRIHIRISEGECVLSLDSSSAPLFKRGYSCRHRRERRFRQISEVTAVIFGLAF